MAARVRLRIVGVELLALLFRLLLVVGVPAGEVNLGELDGIPGPFVEHVRRILTGTNPDHVRNLPISHGTPGGGGIYVRP